MKIKKWKKSEKKKVKKSGKKNIKKITVGKNN